MALNIHFISGLPRSGSTLLAAILRQNPRIHASVESPVGHMCATLTRSMSGANEAAMFLSDEQRRRIFGSVVEAYYAEAEMRPVIFDNSRLWCKFLPAVSQAFPNASIICCVRNIAWILDSVERLVQNNVLNPSRIFKHEATMDVYSRATALVDNGFVGTSLRALRQAWFGDYAGRIAAVRYERLTKDPEAVLRSLYELIGEDYFQHDFENLEYREPEFDRYIGLADMHTVRPNISPESRQTILPPDLFQRHDHEFWNVPGENPRGVLIL